MHKFLCEHKFLLSCDKCPRVQLPGLSLCKKPLNCSSKWLRSFPSHYKVWEISSAISHRARGLWRSLCSAKRSAWEGARRPSAAGPARPGRDRGPGMWAGEGGMGLCWFVGEHAYLFFLPERWRLILNVVLVIAYSKVIQVYVYLHSLFKYSFSLWFIIGYWV